MKVSHLYIYPVKSLQGVEVAEAEVLEKGFRYDRRWMIVDAENTLVTQRTHTQLCQIKLELDEQFISLTYHNLPELTIPISLDSGNQATVTVWKDDVEAIEADQQINDWISKVANMQCKLVYMPEKSARITNPEKSRNGENVSFADEFPYLIIGQASLDDLNSRLEVQLPMHRFRPNIVVQGSVPYAEDHWIDFKIGSTKFYGVGSCRRCVFTTIDQETGEKGSEPLKTLATYRKQDGGIIFGLHALTSSSGTIRVGDKIELAS